MLAKPAPKKEKTITPETHYLVTNIYKDDDFSSQVPQKKDYVSVSKGVHNQKLCNELFLTCKNYILLSKKSIQK